MEEGQESAKAESCYHMLQHH